MIPVTCRLTAPRWEAIFCGGVLLLVASDGPGPYHNGLFVVQPVKTFAGRLGDTGWCWLAISTWMIRVISLKYCFVD